jgi:hypothetical protein
MATALTPDPPPQTPTRVEPPLDEAIYGDMPTPNELYPPEVGMRSVFEDRADDVGDVLGLKHAERVTRHRRFVAVIRETGLSAELFGRDLYNIATDRELQEARGTLGDVNAQVREWDVENRRAFRTKYGDQAEALMQRTQKFIDARPTLRAVLAPRGMRSHPTIIAQLGDYVQRTYYT